MRILFDTNILVSAIAFPASRADDALQRVINGTDELVLSKAIVDELLSVLARKFSREPEQLSRLALFLADLAEIVQTRRRLSVLNDQADNRVLECALACQADAIVTGDREMLKLRNFRRIRIISLREFLESR